MPFGYLGKRLLHLVFVLLGVSLIVFLMLRLIPGDPARLLLGEFASAEDLARLRAQMGLERPLPVQYGLYLGRLLQGDLGRSLRNGAPVAAEIGQRLTATIELAVAAMAIAAFLGIAAGVVSAVRPYSLFDTLAMLLALVGVSMPVFWLGLMLMYLLAVRFPVLPLMGRIGMGNEPEALTGLMLVDTLLDGGPEAFLEALEHLVLPAFTLATVPMAVIARITRSSMLEVLQQDYVRTARAKGLDESVVILRHALRNALLPIVTVLGLNLGLLLSGAVLTETIFSWPGLGRYVVDSLMARDYAAVQGCILVFAVIMAVINLVVDLAYAALDPRIRFHA
ncbi:MAG: ABC transporter permease [Desulfobacterales bacterium]